MAANNISYGEDGKGGSLPGDTSKATRVGSTLLPPLATSHRIIWPRCVREHDSNIAHGEKAWVSRALFSLDLNLIAVFAYLEKLCLRSSPRQYDRYVAAWTAQFGNIWQ